MVKRRSRLSALASRLLAAAAAVAAGLAAPSSFAQVPPHPPGSLCFTQTFWCVAQPPGPPGTPCYCATPYGPVGGIRG
jgi:hypothetical protein